MPSFRSLMQAYVHAFLEQVLVSGACGGAHSLKERLARWLLMTHDRMATDEFQLTQEFLSNMLAVRREAVNKAAGKLQKLKLITYSRGRLTVLDRAGLEANACSCYEIITRESTRS